MHILWNNFVNYARIFLKPSEQTFFYPDDSNEGWTPYGQIKILKVYHAADDDYTTSIGIAQLTAFSCANKNGGMWLQVIAKIVGTDKYVGEKLQGRALDASLVTTDVFYQNI